MVRYATKPEHADANVTLVRAVFEELRERAPRGLCYASYRLADGVSFVHVATHTEANVLSSQPAFQAFQAKLRERVVEPPQVTELFGIGSFGPSPSPTTEGA